MKPIILLALMLSVSTVALAQRQPKKPAKINAVCAPDCTAKNKPGAPLSCKHTTGDLKKRKETVLQSLKTQVLEKKELDNGFAFRFAGTDAMLDELTEFIKTERRCCDFFTFSLSVSGDGSEAWLQLTGPDGAKDFVTDELGL